VSTSDPDARLYRKGSTALRYIGHALRSLLSNSMAAQWREPQAVAKFLQIWNLGMLGMEEMPHVPLDAPQSLSDNYVRID
jgi:hypothetical protein